jgi:hypothetical protein
MPTYEPDRWNEPARVREANNCYNYATNNRRAPAANDPPPEQFPEPGKRGGKRIRRFIEQINAVVDGERETLSIVQMACRTADHAGQPDNRDPAVTEQEHQRPLVGVCDAAEADGLHAESHCEDHADCWRIAVYVRPQLVDPIRPPFADFHFLREDTLPDGSKKWSHKPGDGPVTDQKYDPATERWNGGPITDPRTDTIGPDGYKFCCFLCCCPETQIAAVPRRRPREEYVAFIPGDSLGLSKHTVEGLQSRTVLAAVEAARTRARKTWRKGVGAGNLIWQLHCPVGKKAAVVRITDRAVTLWNPRPRHFADPRAGTAKRLQRYLDLWARPSTRPKPRKRKSGRTTRRRGPRR